MRGNALQLMTSDVIPLEHVFVKFKFVMEYYTALMVLMRSIAVICYCKMYNVYRDVHFSHYVTRHLHSHKQ